VLPQEAKVVQTGERVGVRQLLELARTGVEELLGGGSLDRAEDRGQVLDRLIEGFRLDACDAAMERSDQLGLKIGEVARQLGRAKRPCSPECGEASGEGALAALGDRRPGVTAPKNARHGRDQVGGLPHQLAGGHALDLLERRALADSAKHALVISSRESSNRASAA
jgi:hypothetical protein